MAYNIGIGDAVITTNFSFFATTEVISLVGATPVYVDVDSESYNISPFLLEQTIKKIIKDNKVIPKAIIAVDLFGYLADYSAISKIAKKYNLILIEDAAQSFGASYKNNKSCSFGNIAATSFYPAKPFGCYGDGGAVFTNNSKIAEICKSIRVHGEGIDKYDNIRIGLNSRLDTIQAAVLLRKLEIFDKELKKRNAISEIFNERLKDYLQVPLIKKNHISSWAQYSVVVDGNRDEIIRYLTKKEIPTAIFYKKPFNQLDDFNKLIFGRYEVSLSLSKNIFSLPVHPYLSDEQIEKIPRTIIKYYK